MGSKGSQKTESTSTQKTSADPRAEALYTDVLARAQAAAQTPYQAYQGQMVAGFTPDQLAAMQGVRDVQGAYAPYFQTAAQYGQAAGQAISPAQIQAAMSPYIQGVIQPTLDVMTAEGQKAASRLRGTEAQQGAFGGTRAAVAEANLAAEQERTKNQMVAGLMQQGYSQAVAQAQADRAAKATGAQLMGGVAAQAQALPLQALGAELQTGALQQQLAQQQLAVPYQQFLEQRAYPYQQAQWLASIGQGIGPLLGGTSTGQSTTTTTPPQSSGLGQILGAGLALASIPFTGGASAAYALPAATSALSSMRSSGGRVPHKADGGAVDGSNIDVVGAMAQALQLADAEMSAPQPAQPMPMADGGAAEIVHGALDLAQAMKRSFGGSADHMADGGVPGSTIGVIEVGGRKIPNIFPSSRLSASSFRAPDVKYAPVGDIKTPDYSSVMKGLGAAFKSPTKSDSSSPSTDPKDYRQFAPTTTSYGAFGEEPIAAPTYSMPEYAGAWGGAHGGVVPHHAKDGGSMFDPTPIEYQRPDDVLPTVDSETAFAPEPIPGGAIAPKPITGETIPQVAEAPVSRARSTEESPYDDVWRRVIKRESGGKQFDREGRPLTSSAGAIGIAQVMPGTAPEAARLAGVEFDPVRYRNDAEYNETIGRAYFNKQIKDFGGDVEKAAAAYNAGPARTRQALARAQREGGPYLDYLSPETQNYVASIMSGGAGTASARDLSGARAMYAQQRGLGERSLPSDLTALDTVEGRVEPPVEPGVEPQAGVGPREAERPSAPPTQQQVARANRATSIFENLTGIQLSDEGRMAMMAMGLKMMTTPGSIGTAIGAGGLQGLATYAEAQQQQVARAEKEREYLLRKQQAEREERRLTETERHQREMERLRTVPSGYRIDEKGSLSIIPGGPADPAVIRAAAEAKLPPNLMTPSAVDVAADVYRMTGKLPPNMGRGMQGAQQATIITNRAAEKELDAGGDPSDWATRWQAFGTRATGMRTLENRAAGLTLAEKEASALIPRVRDLLSKVDRTRFPDLNSIIIAGEKKIGNENEIKLGIAIGSLIPVYARVLKPVGQVGQTDMANAQHLLEQKWSTGQMGAALDQFEVELHAAREALVEARKEYGASGPALPRREPPATTPSSPAAIPAPAAPPAGAVAPSATAPAKKTPPAGAVGTKKDTQGGSWYVDRNGNPIERVQ